MTIETLQAAKKIEYQIIRNAQSISSIKDALQHLKQGILYGYIEIEKVVIDVSAEHLKSILEEQLRHRNEMTIVLQKQLEDLK